MRRTLVLVLLLILFCSGRSAAAPLAPAAVPEPLRPWVDWVLHDQPQRFCAPTPDNVQRRLCHWPARLELDADSEGARFEMEAVMLSPGWLELPGEPARWPQQVRVNGLVHSVLDRGNVPAIWLDPGQYRVTGSLRWTTLPESLRLPAGAGVLHLRVGGRQVDHPLRDRSHRLWLGRRAATAEPRAQAERLHLRVYRLIDDDIPAQVVTRIQIEAGGEPREVLLGPALPARLEALSLGGGLPARLEADGRLRVQLRPGQWTLELVARSLAPLTQLRAPSPDAGGDWAPQEVWSLRMHPELRVIEVSGMPPLDPRQTGVPDPWAELPAFAAAPGAVLELAQTRRGSADTVPDQLHLQRQLWLDFDGGGYTVQDHLRGRLGHSWRLDAEAPIALGQVLVDGRPQLITTEQDRVGVEVRNGMLDLVADSRINLGTRRLPAGGWHADLQGVDTTLHLPPAWRLIAAPGSDNVPDTWLSRWTLLDLFLVLVAAIAGLRLFGPGAAALTLLTLALTWHEPGAPRYAWLNLIAAVALLRAVPATFDGNGWLRRLLWAYRWAAAALLVLVALPFAVQQARLSLYPQLDTAAGAGALIEQHARADFGAEAPPVAAKAEPESAETSQIRERKLSDPDAASQSSEVAAARALNSSLTAAPAAPAGVRDQDPQALTQTGPGLPGWTWRSARLSWSGPVTAEQDYTLWLMPPWLTRALGWASIALIALLAARWLELRLRWPRADPSQAAVLMLAVTGGGLMAGAPPAHAVDVLPPQPLLDQLRERLLAPPDCLPHCAHWSGLDLRLTAADELLLRLQAEAQIDIALPLPLPPLPAEVSQVWQPARVLLDGRQAVLQRDDRGGLWVAVGAGVHEVEILGSVRDFDQLQLPTAPALQRARVDAPGWTVSGIDAKGRAGRVIELQRTRREDAPTREAPLVQQPLPPLLRLTRDFRFGLDWHLVSTLLREGNAQGAAVLTLPALPGEVVTGDAVRRKGDHIELAFGPGQRLLRWTSNLEIVPRLSLHASPRSDLFETWRFDISPMWHARFEGLPAVGQQQGDWRRPSFRPWPGEVLDALLSRPAAVGGRILTLDRASLDVQPGQRATDYQLELVIRTSQGGQHALPLPTDLRLQALRIDGVNQPPRQENGRLILPLRPGTQQVQLELRRDQGQSALMRTPALDLAAAGVDARMHLNVPPGRWVLFTGGPALGPAVLFWGVLAVLLVVAVALGRSGLTPLATWQWTLLAIGLSQLPVTLAAVVAGWLFALALRSRIPAHWGPRRFNTVQVVLALWTLAALATLFGAVAQGLLGTPEMQIAGNGSSRYDLHWYQDRYDASLPSGWVLSVSIWWYRGLMLLWALWLANSLLNWLRWGWSQYASGGLWKKSPRVTPSSAPNPGDATP